MSKTKTAVEVLTKAREFIEKGWHQGDFHKRVGNTHAYCAYGAINRANGGTVTGHMGNGRSDTYTAAEGFLIGAVPKIGKGDNAYRPDLVTYNDAPKRTKEQVLRVFDKAIKAATKAEKVSVSASV